MPKKKLLKAGIKGGAKIAQQVVGGTPKSVKKGAAAAFIEEAIDASDNPLVQAVEGAVIGGTVAGLPGAIGGGLIGFLLADGERVTPVDMIAIPAYQYSAMLQGREPTFQIFIKEGELIAPVLPTDFMTSAAVVNTVEEATKKPRKMSSWNKYVANKNNHIKFKSGKNKGKLNLKAMAKAFNKGRKK